MTLKSTSRLALALWCSAMVLAAPAAAVAQTSVFVNEFTDVPLFNPCTQETVLLSGTTTTTITVAVSGSEQLRISVGVVDKGTGLGTSPAVVPPNTYAFSDNQQFDMKFTVASDPTTITESSFSDKMFLKGSRSLDNWMVKRTVKLQINANGTPTVAGITLDSNVCKG